MLIKNIRIAGFIGPINLRDLHRGKNFIMHDDLNLGIDENHALYGFSSVNAPDYLRSKMLANTDGVSIFHSGSDNTNLIFDVKSGAKMIYVEENPAILEHPILIISDCKSLEVFKTQNFGDKIIHFNNGLTHSYKKRNTKVGRFNEIAYFISHTNRKNIRGNVIFGLFLVRDRGNKEELFSGINDMKIFYDIGYHEYQNAEKITAKKAWHKVKRVILTLTFVDENEIIPSRKVSFVVNLRER